ncbi:MAG: alpha/beta hydrolase [Chitinophagaceae bacterium]|nr:alpha/beta hydrolase [Chitinophagaceae bacterium]MCW5929166.1 alpha/beta hydrolase [Chitinophagaceae bacterium]
MNRILIIITFLLIGSSLSAQDTVHFTNGFMANGIHRYGREALYTDLLLYQMYNGSLEAPADGTVLGISHNGAEIKWSAVSADSLNRFRLPRVAGQGRGGMFSNSSYLYLAYTAPKAGVALLRTMGSSAVIVNGAIHSGDQYSLGYLYIPVQLKRGLNEFYVRSGFATVASLIFNTRPVSINTEDPTVPVLVTGQDNSSRQGAIVVLNSSSKKLAGLKLKAIVNDHEVTTDLPSIPATGSRKVPFRFNAGDITNGKHTIALSLIQGTKIIDNANLSIEAVAPGESHSYTFISEIDGSLQYFGVTPQSGTGKNRNALFLSVHGAGVEGIGQARAYKSKDWGTLITATNRRPRGFNWEDWGRLDALEVLSIGKKMYNPDPAKIYLTGHSMGGHGTWFLGATYPDQWAAIAPCAGYPTLKEYGSHDGKIPETTESKAEQVLLRAGNQSDVVKLTGNYKPLGVYIFHGDSDRVVSVDYARQMRKVLADFHPDFAYYEYPGGSHWFGDISVDWPPLFNYFKSHNILPDSAVNIIDFKTSSPGISATYRWAKIYQQERPLEFSRMQLNRDLRNNRITGKTENIKTLKLAVSEFGSGNTITISLDGSGVMSHTVSGNTDSIYLAKNNGNWTKIDAPGFEQKGPHRYGTFKEGFNNRMVFVYGTTGSKAENEWAVNKARFDAESWYYRGNGAVDIVTDKEYATGNFKGRNVVLYGNAHTNAAWNMLLSDAPVKVERNRVILSDKTWEGDDLAAYFVWPIKNTPVNSVAVITGTGIQGMNAANANQYFAGGSGFPDFMIFRLAMLKEGSKAIESAGFFDNNWQLDAVNNYIR